MKGSVFDASVMVKLVVAEPGAPMAWSAYESTGTAVVPDCAFAECASALWKKNRREGYSASAMKDAFRLLSSMDFTVVESEPLMEHALGLALSLAHPVYDCIYVALASDTGLPLATADARLRTVAEASGVAVIWIGES